MDDLRPDVEHQPEMLPRAETDIKHMHHDLVSFKFGHICFLRILLY